MITNLFIQVIEISLGVSIIILLLKATAPALQKHFIVKLRYWIWLVLAIRLLIPFNFTLPVPQVQVELPQVMLEERTSDPQSVQPVLQQPEASAGDFNSDGKQETISIEQPSAAGSPNSLSLLQILSLAWLAGLFGFSLYQAFHYQRYRRKILRWAKKPDINTEQMLEEIAEQLGLRRHIPLVVSTIATSPFGMGFIRPVLVLPEVSYCRQELELILCHELIHFKRNDLYYKLAMLAANAMHWFNPLVYLMRYSANTDMELSCDDAVLQGKTLIQRRLYSNSILATIHKHARQPSITTSYYGGVSAIKKRFQNIFDQSHKRKGMALLMLSVFCIALSASFIVCTTGINAKVSPAGDSSNQMTPEANTAQKTYSGTVPIQMPVEHDADDFVIGYATELIEETIDTYQKQSGRRISSVDVTVLDRIKSETSLADEYQMWSMVYTLRDIQENTQQKETAVTIADETGNMLFAVAKSTFLGEWFGIGSTTEQEVADRYGGDYLRAAISMFLTAANIPIESDPEEYDPDSILKLFDSDNLMLLSQDINYISQSRIIVDNRAYAEQFYDLMNSYEWIGLDQVDQIIYKVSEVWDRTDYILYISSNSSEWHFTFFQGENIALCTHNNIKSWYALTAKETGANDLTTALRQEIAVMDAANQFDITEQYVADQDDTSSQVNTAGQTDTSSQGNESNQTTSQGNGTEQTVASEEFNATEVVRDYAENTFHDLLLNLMQEDGVYSFVDYRVVEYQVTEVSQNEDAILGGFVFAAKPGEGDYHGLWAGNGREGTGDYEGWILNDRQIVLEKQSDGTWICTGLGTGGYRLP